METPKRAGKRAGKRTYTVEEKRQLLANLDIEVEHRVRQFEDSLVDVLRNFTNHGEVQIARVPHLVRGITMAEFADKYGGDINECLRGLQRAKQGGEPVADDGTRKRKWKASEDGPEQLHSESSRAVKNARLLLSATKLTTHDSHKRISNKPAGLKSMTGSILRTPSRTPSFTTPSKKRTVTGLGSPLKPTASSSRVPSASHFNPKLPQGPTYPRTPLRHEPARSFHVEPFLKTPRAATFSESANDSNDTKVRPLKRTTSIIIHRDSSRNQTPEEPDPSSRDSSISSQSQPSAVMRIPTKDGHVLEFNPLLASPSELDHALDGITNSAKKQAREDMAKLVQVALSKWKI